MTTTSTHAYALPLDLHVKMYLGEVLREAGPMEPARLAKRLGWKTVIVSDYLNQPRLPAFSGKPIVTWTIDDLKKMSPTRARILAECHIVAVFDHIANADAVGDILGQPECEIRRIRERAEKYLKPVGATADDQTKADDSSVDLDGAAGDPSSDE